MSAGRYDILIEQGSNFNLYIKYKDNNGDLMELGSGYSARMKIKDYIDGDVIASTESADTPNDTLSIALASSGNNIVVSMTAVNTAALDFDSAVYDLELVIGAQIERVIEGRVKLSKEVTK